MTTFINGSITACLLGIAYILALNLIDKLQAQPIRITLTNPVVIEGDGELIRQAIRDIAYNVFTGSSRVAAAIKVD